MTKIVIFRCPGKTEDSLVLDEKKTNSHSNQIKNDGLFSLLLLPAKTHPNKGHGEGETWSITVLGTLMYIFDSRTKRMAFPLRNKPFFVWTLKLLQILPHNWRKRFRRRMKTKQTDQKYYRWQNPTHFWAQY